MILICDLKEEECAIPIVISRIVGSDKWQITKEKDESIGRRGTRGFVITLNEKKEAIKKKKRKQMEVAGGSVSAYCFATGNDLRCTIVRRVFPFRETSKTIRVWPCSESLDDETLKGRLMIPSLPLLFWFLF